MIKDKFDLESDFRKDNEEVTGSVFFCNDLRVVRIPFDKYIVDVVINEKNEFIGINEIEVNQDFLTIKQKIALSSISRDAKDLYEEEEE